MVIFGMFFDWFIEIFCNFCMKGKFIVVDVDGIVCEI